MNHWLLKTEPSVYSYDDLAKKGRDVWDGVGSALALKHIRAIRKGDELFIYHTGEERAVAGIARALCGPYPDPREENPRLAVFDLEPVRKLKKPVTLARIKADKTFADWELIRIGRLSVMPVSEPMWLRLLKLAGEK